MAKAPEAVRRLVAQFQQNIESYRAQAYNEAQTRAQFIDPFFEARFTRSLPIRTINMSEAADESRHDAVLSLVTPILELNKQLSSASTPHEKTQFPPSPLLPRSEE